MRRSGRAAVGRGTCGDAPVVLARPLTYMNLSGEAAAPLARALGLTPAEVLVVVDDMDLPLGRIRIRKEGGAGGHNGLRSLIRYLGTQEFPRVRIGVGRPAESGVDHVLGAFSREELEPVREAVERAADAVELVLTEGIETAMNRVNAG